MRKLTAEEKCLVTGGVNIEGILGVTVASVGLCLATVTSLKEVKEIGAYVVILTCSVGITILYS